MVDNKLFVNNSSEIKTAQKLNVDNSSISGDTYTIMFSKPEELNKMTNPDSLIVWMKFYISYSDDGNMTWCQLDYKTYKNKTYYIELEFAMSTGLILKFDNNYNILAKYINDDGSSAGTIWFSQRNNYYMAFYYFI